LAATLKPLQLNLTDVIGLASHSPAPMFQIRQQGIQRVQLEKIAVLAYRWKRLFVVGIAPVVQLLPFSTSTLGY
jgi:hypothetical protein